MLFGQADGRFVVAECGLGRAGVGGFKVAREFENADGLAGNAHARKPDAGALECGTPGIGVGDHGDNHVGQVRHLPDPIKCARAMERDETAVKIVQPGYVIAAAAVL